MSARYDPAMRAVVVVSFASVLVLAAGAMACGPSMHDPPPKDLSPGANGAVAGANAPKPLVVNDTPAAGEKAFKPASGDHLCRGNELVVFSCQLEGDGNKLGSLCLVRGSSRTSPEVRARERTNGAVEDMYAPGENVLAWKSQLTSHDKPFLEEVGMLGKTKYEFTRVTEIKQPGTPRTYSRTRKPGPGGEEKDERACKPGMSITDNIDAMVAYHQ